MSDVINARFADYPEQARIRLDELRQLIIRSATELGFSEVDEALKWGELSFSVKGGSPVRIDWKANAPDQYCLFFNCKTRLVETFKELYGDCLVFEGNRAIVLPLSEPLPEEAITHCLRLALTYHKVKHLSLLGA